MIEHKPAERIVLFFAILLLGACQFQAQDSRQFTVLYTNDEHGWMEGTDESNSAANLVQLWREQEAYSQETAEKFLLLSGGDNWTGPAISTWNQGESMVELMNAMGYTASALGNHEFDFGLDNIRLRSAEADYAYLSANTLRRETLKVPEDLGITAYRIAEAGGVRVGIIGLTTRETPIATNPSTVASLSFQDYEETLRTIVPQVEEQGVDLTFVIAHVCLEELEPLIDAVADLGIDLFGAGHCNELVAKQIGDTVLLGGGYHFTSYARADFDLSRAGALSVNFSTQRNEGAGEATSIVNIVDHWREQSEQSLSEVLAYVGEEIPRGSELDQLVVDSWLWADPSAQVAITNAGGIRASLPAGEVSLGDTVAILPFDNTIVALNLSGAEILQVLSEGSRPRVAGLTAQGEVWVWKNTGEELDPAKQYRVLVNSFMYAGGDNYGRLALADPVAYDTGIQYGHPFQDWLRSLGTSATSPVYFLGDK